MIRPRPATGLGTRLFAAQAMIVLSGAATLVVVAILIAPGVFQHHVRRALGSVSPQMEDHLDRAFETTMVVALGTAVGASLLMTLAVSWFLSRRITRPVRDLVDAAERVAAGSYDTAVATSGLGVEFDRLSASFNRMADELARTERRRRDLLADLAHELRTPLSTLEGFLEGLEDGVIRADAGTWETMRDQTARLTRLVHDVGLVSAAEERHLELGTDPLDLAEVAGDSVRAHQHAFDEHEIEVSFASSTDDARVLGDGDRLREVMDNLLSNAARHTSAGGHVAVTVRDDGRWVVVEVADDGAGIDPRDLPHVFERFFRADPSRAREAGGSGIGLSIVRALVAAHHGTINAMSDGPGRGARFVVRLPRAE